MDKQEMDLEGEMHKQEMDYDNGATGIESEKTASRRAWVKPAFEREPLKDASSGGPGPLGDGTGCS
jgi:hypothetical protein